MHGIWKAIGSFVRRADMILLSLCIAASVFGIVVISSATNVKGSAQYVRTQILALVLGIILYVFFTLVDVDIIAEPWLEDELVVFASPASSLLQGEVTLERLAQAQWILREQGSGTREIVDYLLLSHLPHFQLGMELGNSEAIKHAVSRCKWGCADNYQAWSKR